MFFDLNVPVPPSAQTQSKKGKGKSTQLPVAVAYTADQLSAIDHRVDLLVHLGYTVVAFNQIASKKIDTKTHLNVLDGLLSQLKPRPGIVFLKRLTIILDEDSENGFGLTNANASLFTPYDLIALTPTTAPTFSLACLTHSLPSPLTAHIIALPLIQPRLPFHMKHTLVRTAIKNGALFEINYSGALGAEADAGNWNSSNRAGGDGGGGGGGATAAKRNWWAAARELTRVTKGKGIVLSGGAVSEADLRAPRDVSNLITLLGLSPDAALDSISKTPKALVLRARTRKTYRAVFSEPKLVIPSAAAANTDAVGDEEDSKMQQHPEQTEQPHASGPIVSALADPPGCQGKRALSPDGDRDEPGTIRAGEAGAMGDSKGQEFVLRKKKRKKNKNTSTG